MTVRTSEPVARPAHSVQWYERDEDLLDTLVAHLGCSLRADGRAVAIVTDQRRGAILAGLTAAGVDVEEAAAAGRLVLLDGAAVLASFVDDGRIDGVAFDEHVGGLVRQLTSDRRPLAAFGEMVALLWRAGDVSSALELERLWNDLQLEVDFGLLCGYPGDLFVDASSAAAFAEMCELHTAAVAAAPHPDDAEAWRRFPKTGHGARLARRFVADLLCAWRLTQLVEPATLVVSELATNAVLHGGSDFTVALTRIDGGITVTVGDTSPLAPAPRESDSSMLGGRGLTVVDASAQTWGHQALEGGKLVWACIDTGGAEGTEALTWRSGARNR